MKHALVMAGALLLALAPATARAEWWEARTGHFIVYSEGKSSEAKAFVERLERFDGALRVLQKMPPSQPVPDAAKVVVYRFGDTADIGNLAGAQGVAGFYIPRAAYAVAFSPARDYRNPGTKTRADERTELAPETVLFHEYTHHFMLRNFSAAYPSWYVEGFAEVNATIELRPDGSFLVGKPANHRSFELFQMAQLNVKRLLDPKFEYDSIENIVQKYSLGWLTTHYLTFSKPRAGQLNQYLKAVGAGEDSLTAAQRIFGDLNKLNSELQRYKSSNLPAAEVIPPNYTPPQVTLRRLGSDEERFIQQRIRLSRGVTRKQARDMAPGLIQAAAAAPNSLPIQLLAAEVGLDSRNFAAASTAADRALVLDPKSVEALIFKARALIEAPTGEASRFSEARKLLARARNIDKDDPRPLIEFYQSYRKAGGEIPEKAAVALEEAFPLAAQDGAYRMLMARQLLEENRPVPARQVLAPLAFSFDGTDPKKNTAGLIVAMIDAGKPAEALAKLNAEFAKQEKEANQD